MSSLFHKRDKSRIANLLLSSAVCICASSLSAAAAQVQDGRPRYPVTATHIMGAMQARQLPTQGAQIMIAAPITASIEDPQLDIQSVALVSPREIRLRMSCRDHAQCLSFFALASYPQVVSADMLPAKISSLSETPKPDSNSQHAANAKVAQTTAQAPEAAIGAPQVDPTVRIGSAAMLQIDGDRIHIFVQVICLENGSAGDKIRVTTRDHKQSYVAQIVTPTLLKGSF